VGFVNAVLRRASREGDRLRPVTPAEGEVESLALYTGHPSWWTRRIVDRLGWSRAFALAEANNEPARTVARVLRGFETDEVRETLASEGVESVCSPLLPRALHILSGPFARSTPFLQGAIYVQDEAAQLVAMLVGPNRRGPILDGCAAPGGKAIQASELARAGTSVIAIDRSRARLRRLAENVRRTHAEDVLAVQADLALRAPPVPDGSIEAAIVDAPCSGTGTFRRHPEIRWRLRPERLREFAARQLRILRNVSCCVRPGGRLVYAVCSVEPEEGEQVVDAFLEREREFARIDPSALLPEPCRGFIGPDLALRTGPEQGVDGFFAVALDRRGG
jgi:16S rRNA (cytosine967-C5)-methyltransferase